MKGLQDYSLPLSDSFQFFRFLKASQEKDNNMDFELQQKIDHEIKMRDGTAKLMAASKHPAQLLEAAKNLLTSNNRMIAYMTELQKRKNDEVMGKNLSVEGNQTPCKAKVGITDIRIPLMWKDSDHFKNKGDHRRYVVFCLLKIGTEIYDTTLIKDVDRSMTDITFEDAIVFQNIPHDFECKLEIYCHKLYDDLTIASTPKKIKKKFNDLSSSVGRSVGRRLSGLKEDADSISGNMIVGPKYDLMGTGTMRLSDASTSIKTHDLVLETSTESELPLFGHFCCRLAVQPNCLSEETMSGYLHIQASESVQEDWGQFWCLLKNLELNCWKNPANMHMVQPDYHIPVTKDTQLCEADPSMMSRPHTFHIITQSYDDKQQYTLSADNGGEMQKWWDGLQQHLLDQVIWQKFCENRMEIKPSSQTRLRSSQRKSSDSSSLYGEMIGSPSASKKKSPLIPEEHPEFSPLTLMLRRLTNEDKEAMGVSPLVRQGSRGSKSSRDSTDI